MAGHALSERVKRIRQRQLLNTKLQAALDEYKHEQEKPKAICQGLRPIAKEHGVAWRTLGDHANGKQSMSVFHESKTKLTHSEERVLVDFILESAERALSLSRDNIVVHANEILKARKIRGEPVGIVWINRFLDRYRSELQTHWSSPLATERAQSLNPETVKAWFELVCDELVMTGIRPENIYRMDESGFPPSNQGVQRAVAQRGVKRVHKSGSANQENVTAIITICADGTALKPTIIFKGKNFLAKWGADNVSKAS